MALRSLLGLALFLTVGATVGCDSRRRQESASARDFFENISGAPGGLYESVTGDESNEGKGYWNRLYDTERFVFGREPSPFLKKHLKSLPKGRVLDIAMGEGRNAVFLAKQGFDVEGVDLSEVALQKAHRWAEEEGVVIRTILTDVAEYEITPNSYDVILNINFLERKIFPGILRGLKKGGVLIFENPTLDQLKLAGSKDLKVEFLLKPGELRSTFPQLAILEYEETNDGKDAVARMIAQRKK
jgi:SAM-dependent methyltransferase